ncbi:hypothetical protein Tco_0262614, partial [Tanacetum coccineum]
ERIKKTKRSKNDQKPTRNEKKTKTRARVKKQPEFTSRISPTQQERQSKQNNEVKGPKLTSLQSLKALLSFKVQGLNLQKEETLFIKGRKEEWKHKD